MSNKKPNVAGVLLAAELFSAVQQYLYSRPYGEVAQLVQGLAQSSPLTPDHVTFLNTFGKEEAEPDDGQGGAEDPEELEIPDPPDGD